MPVVSSSATNSKKRSLIYYLCSYVYLSNSFTTSTNIQTFRFVQWLTSGVQSKIQESYLDEFASIKIFFLIAPARCLSIYFGFPIIDNYFLIFNSAYMFISYRVKMCCRVQK